VTLTPNTLRVVAPPVITGGSAPTKEQLMPVSRTGARSKEALLMPLSPRERLLVCAMADTLEIFRPRAEHEPGTMSPEERRALLGLMVAFEDATGCKYTDARWNAT
jgi:hypothetical protein